MSDYTIGFAVSVPVVIGVVAVAIVVASWGYRKTIPPVSRRRRWTLVALRAIGIGLLLLLLLEPVLTASRIRVEAPLVLVAIDESASMTLAGMDSVRAREALAVVNALRSSSLRDHIRWISFGDSVSPLRFPLPGDTLRSDRVATRIDAPLAAALDSLRHSNVGAILLLSDGRYNVGSNPIYPAEAIGAPIFAIGFGDTTEPQDLSVQSIVTNEIAYIGTEIPVEVRVRATGIERRDVSVVLQANGSGVATKRISVSPREPEQVLSFTYRPTHEGLVRLKAVVTPVAGEVTAYNNTRSSVVTVKPNRRSYAIFAGGPNPDVAFVCRNFESDRAIRVRTYIERGDGRFLDGELSADALSDVESIVLIDFPTRGTADATLRMIREAVWSKGTPLLLIGGSRLDPARLKSLESILPVTVGTPRTGELLVVPVLTSAGKTSPITRLSNAEWWAALPPLYRSETSYIPRSESEVLLNGRLAASSFEEPLVVSRRIGRNRSVAVLGYGLYRWELLGEGTATMRGDSNVRVLGTFISNAARWLGSADGERRVRVASAKPLYSTGEKVRVLAQVYDESYDPISDAIVTTRLYGPGGDVSITLAPSGNGHYEGLVGRLAPGDYVLSARASRDGRFIGTDASGFSVGDLGPEFQEPTMDAVLLRAMTERSGGRFYRSRESKRVVEDLQRVPTFASRSVETRADTPLWHLPWVLAAALTAFATEWFLRKRSGMV